MYIFGMKFYLLILVTAITYSVKAQNLVPNPSFEDTVSCPQFYGVDGYFTDWSFFRGTPDYFHNCSSSLSYNNSWGYQLPRSGEGYVSVAAYQTSTTNAREHLGVQLISSLTIGVKYYLTFYVSTAHNNSAINIATNKMGALLAMTPYSNPSGTGLLPNSATIYTDSIINDTLNWVKISGSFVADSSYQYLSLGSFFDDNNVDTNYISNPFPPSVGLYYIDDVCLSDDSNYCAVWTSIKEDKNIGTSIYIYPNPATDFVNIIFEDNKVHTVVIYNSIGEIVLTKSVTQQSSINTSSLAQGIYYIQTSTNNNFISKKLIIY